MKHVEITVKSKGTELGKVKIPVYETLEEAIKASSKEAVLASYNKRIATDTTNSFRAGKTRTTSPAAQLARMAKADPNVAKKIEAMLAELSK